MIWESPQVYLDAQTDIKDKVNALNVLIDGLYTAATTAVTKGHVSEYQIDTGQTKIKTVYRNSTEIFASIKRFEQLRQMYINRLNGHSVVLKDRGGLC